ncbi:hypothetical protein ACFXJ8_19980 [Nonomuraea sp. NPDC059194]|uniref:hypothetical protein n=1 Tax=Nonomuraea sp. NPDC059194 TaxID=3346764 RepID=UPI0036A621B8
MSALECGTPPLKTTLFFALIDDAGLFPPTSLHMDEAVARHQRDLDSGSTVLTHRFLCPASRLDGLRRQAQQPRLIGLIVDTETVPDFSDLPVDFVESREIVPVPEHVRLFVEVHPKHIPHVPHGVSLKVRCGGMTADAFPSVAELAEFITHCVERDQPFKATAGLHHAVRHFDPSLGVDRHGFLNLVLAVCAAIEKRDPMRVLASTDVGDLVRQAQAIPEETAVKARNILVSYGSCSTTAPLDDLKTLGLDA